MTDYTNYTPVTKQDGGDSTPIDHHEHLHQETHDHGSTAAVDLIRQKVDNLYSNSAAPKPTAAPKTLAQIEAEVDAHHQPQPPAEAKTEPKTEAKAKPAVPHSKHHQYMEALKMSGKSLAEIQVAWRDYYAKLSDIEKHEVWREFYDAAMPKQPAQPTAQPAAQAAPAQPVSPQAPNGATAGTVFAPTIQHYAPHPATPAALAAQPTAANTAASRNPLAVHSVAEPAQYHLPPAVKAELLRNIKKRNTFFKPKQQFQSLLFGLGCGVVAVIVVLFSFFNEVIIAPFIQPSRTVNDTPIIIGADGVAPTDKNEVIIPKINVEIPLDYSAKTIGEEDIQNGLENGVVHYPTTPLPGQQGNTAFFGHSSNNIFNKGKYKFAFVLLHELVVGDTFYLTNNGTAYAYQVTDKKVVEPNNVSILDPIAGKTATATLITCDPPGTTLHRLVVIGEQVSPAPEGNQLGGIQTAADSGVKALPDNGPSLWERFKKWLH